jgi:hypothetical protein
MGFLIPADFPTFAQLNNKSKKYGINDDLYANRNGSVRVTLYAL